MHSREPDSIAPAERGGRFHHRAGARAASAVFLILLGLGCFGSPSSNDDGPDDTSSSEPGVFLSTTSDSGIATVENDSGEVLLVAQAMDSLGTPLPNLTLTYLASSPEPMVAFNADSGEAVGTFVITPGDAGKRSGGVTTGVFILSLIDPTMGRLYDPEKDDFVTGVQNNIASIRHDLDFDDIQLILDTTPGLEDKGIKTKAEIMAGSDGYDYWIDEYDQEHSFSSALVVLRVATFVQFMEDQHDRYRYQIYKDTRTGVAFYVPLGLTIDVQLVSPANGAAYTQGVDREQTIWGGLDVSPDVVITDGGEFHIYVNGALYGGTIQILSDGGTGATFTGQTPITLGEGETTVEVKTIVNVPNRGFETPEDGSGGTGFARVSFQGEIEGPFTPSIGNLNYPVSAPCPDMNYVFEFDFSDSDGDITTFWQHLVTYRADIDQQTDWGIDQLPASYFPCLTGTSGECSVQTSYEDADGGDWIRLEFWLSDSGGRESNHLSYQLNITGDCDPFGKTASPGPVVEIEGCR